jgi:hypothetical protein
MLRRLARVKTDVSEEPGTSFIRVTRIGELGTTQAATSNRRTLRRNTRSSRGDKANNSFHRSRCCMALSVLLVRPCRPRRPDNHCPLSGYILAVVLLTIELLISLNRLQHIRCRWALTRTVARLIVVHLLMSFLFHWCVENRTLREFFCLINLRG